ncbi:MAG: hypothetical protein GFH25_541324n39 [Chloroflexi bacterium AL-N10]|nr:hypothetical protein [Chloroflexi bacterium AL-N10]
MPLFSCLGGPGYADPLRQAGMGTLRIVVWGIKDQRGHWGENRRFGVVSPLYARGPGLVVWLGVLCRLRLPTPRSGPMRLENGFFADDLDSRNCTHV